MRKQNKQLISPPATTPRFVSLKKAESATICFKRTVGTKGKNQSHTSAEIDALEALLTVHFRQIGLVGEFTLAFSERVNGSPHSHGLTVQGVKGNVVRLAYQPGDNGTRFAYALLLPAHLVTNVHEKLSASVKAGLPKPAFLSDQVRPDSGGSHVTELASKSVTTADVVGDTGSRTQRVAEVEVGGDLTVIQFADCVLESVIPTLRRDLETELRKFPHEGIFTVKCGGSSTAFVLAGEATLSWCNLQPGARGLGFWHRVSLEATWVKYALVADKGFDIAGLAEKLDKVPEVTESVPVYPNNILKPKKLRVKDFVADVEVIRLFLTTLMKKVQTGTSAVFPSKVMTKTFHEVIDDTMSPYSVGLLAREWALDRYLTRWHPTPGVTYYYYGLGAKGKRLLGLEAALVAPAPQVVTEPPIIKEEDSKISVPAEKPHDNVPVSLVSQPDTLVQVAAMLQKLQHAAAKIEQFEAALAASEDARRALEGQVEALTAELHALRAQSQTELLAALLAEAAAVKI